MTKKKMSELTEFVKMFAEMNAKIEKLEKENRTLKRKLNSVEISSKANAKTAETKEEKLEKILWGFGLSKNYAGYQLMVDSVLIYIQIKDKDVSTKIRKEVYFDVAKKYHLSIQNVERNLRTLRNKMMERPEKLNAVLGYIPLKPPYPKDIIASLAKIIEN